LRAETGMHFGDRCKGSLACLDDKEMQHFMEVVQRHPHTSVMQAPKITMLDGQNASCRVGEDQFFATDLKAHWDGNGIWCLPVSERVQLGLNMQLHTALSADNRYVDVALDVKQTELESPKIPLVQVIAKIRKDRETGQCLYVIQSFPSNRQKDF